jgi:hypothetical protein
MNNKTMLKEVKNSEKEQPKLQSRKNNNGQLTKRKKEKDNAFASASTNEESRHEVL